MLELATVAAITVLAVISPGADFAMVSRNSILYGRAAGLLSSLGIATGVQLHVFYTMIGVGLLIRSSPNLFIAIKILGALYLIYIGYRTFFSTPPSNKVSMTEDKEDSTDLSAKEAFKNGFFTNALNPKTTLFVLSIYTQVVNPETPIFIQIAYGIFMSLAHWIWFSLVCLFLSEKNTRAKLLAHQVLVNQVIGVILAGLGVWLSLSSTS